MILTVKITDLIKLFFREERKFYFFVCKTAKYLPHNILLFKEAFVHKSLMQKYRGRAFYNERLEFLGDAVLDLLVADILFQKYSNMEEGQMSKIRSELVSRHSLNGIALQLGMGEYIKYCGGLSAEKTHLPGNVLEAFVAAIYLDAGLGKAKKFVRKNIASDMQIEATIADNTDYKSLLLQWSQKNKCVISFDSSVLSHTNNGEYKFQCTIYTENRKKLGIGAGKSKKIAEQMASEQALNIIDSEQNKKQCSQQ